MSLKRMKKRNTVGPDQIAIDVLEDHDMLTPLVTNAFNEIFDSGNIPEAWRLARVKPLYKGRGSAETPGSYRAICLTSHLYEVFTSILCSRLTMQCLSRLSLNQHGFLPHRSCDEAVGISTHYTQSIRGAVMQEEPEIKTRLLPGADTTRVFYFSEIKCFYTF